MGRMMISLLKMHTRNLQIRLLLPCPALPRLRPRSLLLTPSVCRRVVVALLTRLLLLLRLVLSLGLRRWMWIRRRLRRLRLSRLSGLCFVASLFFLYFLGFAESWLRLCFSVRFNFLRVLCIGFGCSAWSTLFSGFLFLLLLMGLNWAYALLYGLLASMSYMKSVWESYAESMVEATGSSL